MEFVATSAFRKARTEANSDMFALSHTQMQSLQKIAECAFSWSICFKPTLLVNSDGHDDQRSATGIGDMNDIHQHVALYNFPSPSHSLDASTHTFRRASLSPMSSNADRNDHSMESMEEGSDGLILSEQSTSPTAGGSEAEGPPPAEQRGIVQDTSHTVIPFVQDGIDALVSTLEVMRDKIILSHTELNEVRSSMLLPYDLSHKLPIIENICRSLQDLRTEFGSEFQSRVGDNTQPSDLTRLQGRPRRRLMLLSSALEMCIARRPFSNSRDLDNPLYRHTDGPSFKETLQKAISELKEAAQMNAYQVGQNSNRERIKPRMSRCPPDSALTLLVGDFEMLSNGIIPWDQRHAWSWLRDLHSQTARTRVFQTDSVNESNKAAAACLVIECLQEAAGLSHQWLDPARTGSDDYLIRSFLLIHAKRYAEEKNRHAASFDTLRAKGDIDSATAQAKLWASYFVEIDKLSRLDNWISSE